MKNIVAEKVVHKNENRIALRFPYDTHLISLVKELSDARWSSDMRCWRVKESDKRIHHSQQVKLFISESDDKFCEEILRVYLQDSH